MNAVLFDGSAWLPLQCASQTHLLQVAAEYGMNGVAKWPVNNPRYALYLVSGKPVAPIIAHPLFHRYRSELDDRSIAKAYHWLQTAHESSAYALLRETVLRPTPNGGTNRTKRDISKWVDTGIDIFTRFSVSEALKRNEPHHR